MSLSLGWYEQTVRAQPHHTDFGGIVWHGHYVAWLEACRVDLLRAVGLPFEDFVAARVNLVVVSLALKYRQPVRLGEAVIVRTRPAAAHPSLRLPWDYEIIRPESHPPKDLNKHPSPQPKTLCLTAQVVLAAVNDQGVLYRRSPPLVTEAYRRIEAYLSPPAA